MSERPYTRVYHQLADEYPDIYDGTDLAAFVRLLIAADQTWPSSARWAGYATRPEVQRLADAGLLHIDGVRYRIRGMDKERNARSNAASNAARIRWGNADGNAETMPNQAKPSQAEPSRAKPSPDGGIFDAYYRLTARPPSSGAIAWLNRLTDEYDEPLATAVLASEWKADPDPSTVLGRVQTKLADHERRAAKAAEERKKRGAIDEQRDLAQRLEAMTPEERQRAEARAAEVRASVAGLVKGVAQ